MELTPEQKIEALRKANPKLTLEQACQLLGLDPQEHRSSDFFSFFEDIVKGNENKKG